MRTPHASTMSNLCVSWINDELRKEVARREQIQYNEPSLIIRMARPMFRMKTFVIAGLSGLSPFAAKMFS